MDKLLPHQNLSLEDMDGEIWKDIEGYEGHYQISSFGRLKSFKKFKEGFILSNVNSKKGYFSVVLRYKDKIKSTRIHRLVAEHFIENSENKTYVNHKDLNKQNNHYLNLEWCTPRENVIHSIKSNSNQLFGMINYNTSVKPKKIIQLSISGEQLNVFKNSKEASLITGVCARNILQVASKSEYKKGLIRSQAGGYKWQYL
jgi:hypothetical protein